MPTENRSSNTEIVSVPRELLERVTGIKSKSYDIEDAMQAGAQLRVLLARPAEQHQVEPVTPKLKEPRYKATPCRFAGKDGYFQVGDALVYDNEAEAIAAAKKKNTDLAMRYYEALAHADPAEVERLRDEISGWADRCRRLNDESMAWMHDNDTLRAQLAERDALLAEIEKRHWSGVDFDLPADLVARIKALSASASPEAKS